METSRVRVTLDVPKHLIPKGEKEPGKALAALITAALWEFRISVVYVSKHDAKQLVKEV
jgi:hypothetical protein